MRGPRPGGLGSSGRRAFLKAGIAGEGAGAQGPGGGWDYPAAAVAWMNARGRPWRSRAGLGLGCSLGSRPSPAGRVVPGGGENRDGPAAGMGSRDDPAAGTARPGGRRAETKEPRRPRGGTEARRPRCPEGERGRRAGVRDERNRRSEVRCGERGLRRSRSCGRCAGRPRRSL